jgi:K+-sensing histidine kinase KdpD
MDFQKAASAPITINIGESSINIPRLTLRQASELLTKWGAEERKILVEQMKLAELPSAEKLTQIKELDRYTQSLSFGISTCTQPCRSWETIAKVSDEATAGKFVVGTDTGYVAMKLWGVEPKPEVVTDGGKQQDQNATG